MNWIDEKTFARMVCRKPRTVRRLVKNGIWDIPYSAPNGRTYQYSEQGINKLLLKFSSTTK